MLKLTGLSLFSNVGVAEAYLKDVGVNIVLANELIGERAAFYKHIYPRVEMICGDISDNGIRNSLVKKAIKQHVNFIIATPPCQGMSKLGSMNPYDVRNQLIYFAVDIIKKVKPLFVLLENVPQSLITHINVDGVSMLIPDYLRQELGKMYVFNSDSKIKAMDYGVPQMRPRSIFLLSRKSTGVNWEFPLTKKRVVTLYDAIGNIPSLDPLLREGYEETLKIFPNFEKKREIAEKISKWHFPPTHNKRQVEWMLHTPSGTSAIFNKVYFPQKPDGTRISAHENQYRRHAWDKPCRTITQNNGVISSLCCVHPGRQYKTLDGQILYSDPRVLTIYELLIVSTLPVNWDIPGWAKESTIRHVIGEGIPPLLVKCIMKNLKF